MNKPTIPENITITKGEFPSQSIKSWWNSLKSIWHWYQCKLGWHPGDEVWHYNMAFRRCLHCDKIFYRVSPMSFLVKFPYRDYYIQYDADLLWKLNLISREEYSELLKETHDRNNRD